MAPGSSRRPEPDVLFFAMQPVVGRFAPSPTGPLHMGSLVAAAGSWILARRRGGSWIVRIEDLDTPRVVPGSAEEILETLRIYGLAWDGEPVRQSERTHIYQAALDQLRDQGDIYDCACSRRDLAPSPSAPAATDERDLHIYPGTCRNGIPPGRTPRSTRFRTSGTVVQFNDLIRGTVSEDVEAVSGDFVVRRADGLFAYQLAVVVDDAMQGITQVVRGGDLLDCTPRQIALQRALGHPTPEYAHLPLVLGADGTKMGKRDGALPVAKLDRSTVLATLTLALGILGIEARGGSPEEMLRAAVNQTATNDWYVSLRERTIPCNPNPMI